MLPDIDVIVMDRNQDLHISKLPPLLNKYQPVILVQGIELFGKAEYKFLKTYIIVKIIKTLKTMNLSIFLELNKDFLLEKVINNSLNGSKSSKPLSS